MLDSAQLASREDCLAERPGELLFSRTWASRCESAAGKEGEDTWYCTSESDGGLTTSGKSVSVRRLRILFLAEVNKLRNLESTGMVNV